MEASAEIPRPFPHPPGGVERRSAEADGETVAEVTIPAEYPRGYPFHAIGKKVISILNGKPNLPYNTSCNYIQPYSKDHGHEVSTVFPLRSVCEVDGCQYR